MTDVQSQDRGVARLVTDLATDTVALARMELELAKAELAAKARTLGGGIGVLLVGAFVALTAYCVLIAAAVLGLAEWLEPWLAAVIVFGILIVLAAACIAVGASMVRRGSPPVPTAAIEHAKQDVEWLKQQLK